MNSSFENDQKTVQGLSNLKKLHRLCNFYMLNPKNIVILLKLPEITKHFQIIANISRGF